MYKLPERGGGNSGNARKKTFFFSGGVPLDKIQPPSSGQEAMKAVDKRANELNNEYITKARNTVWQYCGTAQGTIGPVETKLRPNCATHPATYVLSGHYDIDMLTCKN